MGAALFLASLGVDEQTIMEDYLSSNEYLGDKYSSLISAHPELEALITAKKEYLQAGLDRIKEKHGSIENYLKETLGVDMDKMKRIYLYE
jgi:protein-tyrosine phosphatase